MPVTANGLPIRFEPGRGTPCFALYNSLLAQACLQAAGNPAQIAKCFRFRYRQPVNPQG